MRLLLLTLAAFAFLPQVIPAFGGKKCWQKMGHCRRFCEVNEELKSVCKNGHVCCVPVKQSRKPESSGKEVPRIFSTQASHLSEGPMDFIVTIPTTSSNLEVDISESENEQSDQVLDTEMSPPPVNQSS